MKQKLLFLLAALLSTVMVWAEVDDEFITIDGLTYIVTSENPNTIMLVDCEELTGGLAIPDIVNGYSVTSISDHAFSGCSGLTGITIPNSVTWIGKYAFTGCSGLTSIDIPNSVTWIGERAFAGCSGLPSIDIPNSVTNIGEDAFYECSGLTSVSIGSRVRFISSNSFYGCIALTSITVSEDNTIFDSRNHCNAIIESSSNTLKCGCKSTIIPNSVTSIGGYAFNGCRGLTSVTIPNSVTSIGYAAFSGCLLRNVYMNCVNPPKLPSSGSSFSAGTLNHATLYVPYGTWPDYAYNDKWGDFIHIKEMTTSTENLAPRRAYMLMNRVESSYAIYDPTSDEVMSLSSLNNVDEDDPNQCWQMTKVDGETYLYNIGAKKFAKSYTNEVGFTLSDTPCPITMENGEDGIMLGAQRKAQWTFVVNEEQSTNQNLNNVITGIQSTVKQSQENTVDWYTLDGRNMEKEPIEKGVYIVNGKKVYVN